MIGLLKLRYTNLNIYAKIIIKNKDKNKSKFLIYRGFDVEFLKNYSSFSGNYFNICLYITTNKLANFHI